MKTYKLRIKLNEYGHDYCHHVQRKYFNLIWLRISVNISSIRECQEFINRYPTDMDNERKEKKHRKYIQRTQKISLGTKT